MSLNNDPYYQRPEVSNSDLSWLEKYWLDQKLIYDIEAAYRFGNLLDAMVTEQHAINYFKNTCYNVQFTQKEFDLAAEMKRAFWKDEFCKILANNSEMQKEHINPRFEIEHEGFRFWLAARIKFDFDAMVKLCMTGDLKSTTAKTYKQFIAACEHFGYFRQRAWYMDVRPGKRVDKDMLIGISKENFEVFKVPIVRDSPYYKKGKEQYEELAFKWHYLFGEIENTQVIQLEDFKIAI